MSESFNDELVSKLYSKITTQANELMELTEQIQNSKRENEKHHSDAIRYSSPGSSLSETAQKRRMEKSHTQQIDALQRQLDLSELRFVENMRNKKKLMLEIEKKTREASFLQKQCSELQKENQSLKAQVESTVRVSNLPHKSRGIRSVTPTRQMPSPHPFNTLSQEEFVSLKRTMQLSQQEVEHFKNNENQMRMEIKILKDALDFRSEEIGLSGHADLLAKVARLRGEVTALRDELNHKESVLQHVEENKSELYSKHIDTQKQLEIVQKRLAQTETDTYRLRHTDLGNSLKVIEAERDTLNLYLENDMNKSAHLARQVEQLESDLRTARKTEAYSQERISQLTSATEADAARMSALEDELNSQNIRCKELQHTNSQLCTEKDETVRKLDRKTLEAEELNKMYLDTLMQKRNRDEELHNKNDIVNTLRARLQDAEIQLPHLQSEVKNLRERLTFTEDELSVTRDTLTSVEPRLARIEPEYTRLRSERDAWHAEKMDMLNELVHLRSLERSLSDMNRDISDPSLGPVEIGGDDTTHNASGSNNTQSNSAQQHYGHITLSQRHSMWIALPSIRNLNKGLYERIRSLASDLHRQEVRCKETETALALAEQQLRRVERENVSNLQQLSQSQESSIHTISELTRRVQSAESEALVGRAARITLDQVRVMLRSFPGSISDLYPSDTGRHCQSVEQYVNELNDNALAEFVGRVMQYNSTAVTALSESQFSLSQLQRDHNTLAAQHSTLQRERNNLDISLTDTLSKLNAAQSKLQTVEEDCRSKLESATDLAEQQNVLTLTLQGNIEKCGREIHMKNAQITFHVNQNNATRVHLFNLVRDYCTLTGIAHPEDNAKIPDLIDFLAHALKVPQSNSGLKLHNQHLHHQDEYREYYPISSISRQPGYRHHDDQQLRESMLTAAYHGDARPYRSSHSSSAAFQYVSPEKFTQQYGNSSSNDKRRSDSARKKKASTRDREYAVSSDDHVRSGSSGGSEGRQQKQPTRRADSPHRSGNSRGISRSPPQETLVTPMPKRTTPTRRSTPPPVNNVSRRSTNNSNTSHSVNGMMKTNSNNSSAIHERYKKAQHALALLRE